MYEPLDMFVNGHIWCFQMQMRNRMVKEDSWIFCSALSVTVSAVQCHSRMASAPLLSLRHRAPPRNDVMYTHLMINMQRWKQGIEEQGVEEKQRGERPDGNLFGTVNTAWINLSERWQHEAWPGNKWGEGEEREYTIVYIPIKGRP